MLFSDVMALIRRRIRWFGLVAVLAVAAGIAVFATTDDTYRSNSVIAVLPKPSGDNTTNPFFTSPQALSELAFLMRVVLQSDQKRKEIQEEGVRDFELEFESSSSSRSATLLLTAQGSTPEDSQRAAGIVAQRADEILTGIQDLSGIPEEEQAGVFTVVLAQPGTASGGDAIKAGVAAGLLVGLAGFVLIAAADVSSRGRRERQFAASEL